MSMSDSSSGTEMAGGGGSGGGGHERIRESAYNATAYSTHQHQHQHPPVNAYMSHDQMHQNAFLRGPSGLAGNIKARALNKQSGLIQPTRKPSVPVIKNPFCQSLHRRCPNAIPPDSSQLR